MTQMTTRLLAIALLASVSTEAGEIANRLKYVSPPKESPCAEIGHTISDSTIMGVSLNNPVNIRYSPANSWKGQTGKEKGFVKFDSHDNGYRAAYILLKNYIRKHDCNTLAKIAYRFAPPCENNTQGYIQDISNHSGVAPHEILQSTDSESLAKIIAAMTLRETGITVDWKEIHRKIQNQWTKS